MVAEATVVAGVAGDAVDSEVVTTVVVVEQLLLQ
jgi:hypothetical protein